MHVGLHHQRVTPPAQPPARLFSRDRVAALHHQSPHLRKQFRPHQRHVVDNCLKLVMRLVGEVAVAQHRPHRLVMVREIVQAVEIATQPVLENSQD